ncbi:hypothetical protein SAMD00079811_19380 [Scytonema sp. HK-05]|nr:hypothetical protein SAMD00079811_19380 [Scytonema sp. HK-05]
MSPNDLLSYHKHLEMQAFLEKKGIGNSGQSNYQDIVGG